MCTLLSSVKDSDDLSVGFDRGRGRDELSLYRNIKGKYHLKTMVKDVFEFAQCQEKATDALGYKLTLE